MKEQKRTACTTRANIKKTGACLLAFCMLGSIVGCTDNSNEEGYVSSGETSFFGSLISSGVLGDYETGAGLGGNVSSDTTGNYETEDVVTGSGNTGAVGDYETDAPNLGGTATPEGTWDDYVGEEEEGANMPTELVEDSYRQQGGYSYYYHYQHTPTTMPIAAWSPPPPNLSTSIGNFTTNQITLDNYQKMADAGFNAAYGLYERLLGVTDIDKTNVTNALNYANQTGIVYYVKDSSVAGNLADMGSSALENYYSWYMNKPAYGGTLLVDEPGMNSFDSIAEAQNLWRETKYGNVKNLLVNHLPAYASQSQLQFGAGDTSTPTETTYTWAQFVQTYIEKVNPAVYSYDFYPYRGGGSYFDNYYQSLSDARTQAAAGNIPYWVFCQVGYFNTGTTLTYAQTALQVSTALAYGAKGIQWFNYWQPLEFAVSPISACVDHFGVKTIYYDMVQKINNHIAAVDDVLMQCCNKGVIQIGSSYDDIPTTDLLGSYGALTSTSGSTGSALIGCFEYRDTGKYVYYIASNNYSSDASINFTFNNSYDIETIKYSSSSQESVKANYTSRSSMTFNVSAGEGMLVVVG